MTRCTGDARRTRGRSRLLSAQAQGLPRPPRHRLGRGRDHAVGRLRRQRLRQAERPRGRRHDLVHDLVVGAGPAQPSSSSRATTSIAAREAELLGQGRLALDAGLRHEARRPRRPARTPRAPARRSSRPKGSSTPPASSALPFLPAVIGPRHRPGQRRREGRAAQRAAPLARGRVPHRPTPPCRATARAPEVVAAIRRLDADPEVEVIIVARGGGDFQNLLGFSDERARAGRGRGIHAHRVSAIGHEADRPAARRGRRPAGIDADGCREARRARRRRGARARRAGAGAPRHAALVDPRPRDRPASGTCARVRRSPTPAGSSTAAPRSSRGGSRAARELVDRCVERQVARVGELARPPARALAAGARSTAATRSCSCDDGHVLARRRRARPTARACTLTARRGRARRAVSTGRRVRPRRRRSAAPNRMEACPPPRMSPSSATSRRATNSCGSSPSSSRAPRPSSSRSRCGSAARRSPRAARSG